METLVLLAAALFMMLAWLTLEHRRRLRTLPPGPAPLPLIGNLLELRHGPHLAFQRFKKYGELFTISIGHTPIVVLNSARAVQEAFVDQADVFAGRPNSGYIQHVSHNAGIVIKDGPVWKEHRRFVMRMLCDFGVGKTVAQDIVHEECSALKDRIEAITDRPVSTPAMYCSSICNVIARLTFGERTGTDDPKFNEFYRSLIDLINRNPIILLPIFSWVVKVPPLMLLFNFVTGMHRQWDSLHGYIREKLNESDAAMNAMEQRLTDLKQANALCEALLIERNNQQAANPNAHTFTEWQLIRDVTELFAAGTETTSTTLAWTTLLLAIHPDIQRRVQAEIEQKIGVERLPEMADRVQLPFVCAVMDEVMRWSSIVATNMPHRSLADTQLLGYSIPANTIFQTNLYGIHRDPSLWARPNDFYPEHFLSPDGEYRPSRHLIPFSVGKRACLGESLARMEYFCFLVAIMQTFSVSLADHNADGEALLRPTAGIVLQPQPHEVVFSRLSSD